MSDRRALLVGFDSAWTANNRGAIVPLLRHSDGRFEEITLPLLADFNEAANYISDWQAQVDPGSTMILIDQPVVVTNSSGQRPVERIVSSAVCRRGGGMQPANTSRRGMFGPGAPVTAFLRRFDAIETYPVQVMMALGWLLEDKRPCGRLPKYNPANRRKFRQGDWQFVCQQLLEEFQERNLDLLSGFLRELHELSRPRKQHQDQLDACICLLVAIQIAESSACIVVGNATTGSIVSPHGHQLREELEERCRKIDLDPHEWVREFSIQSAASAE